MSNTESKRIKVALPGGEREADTINYLTSLGLEINKPDRCYFLPINNMPVDLVVIRASDVARLVDDNESDLTAGMTGSDILWNEGMKERGIDLPVKEKLPDAKTSSLYIGATPNLLNKLDRAAQVSDLYGSLIATKYSLIAREILGSNTNLITVPGKDEAMQYIFKDCWGVLGIKQTGDTLEANNIKVIELLGETTLRVIEAAQTKVPASQRQILDDFLGMVIEARKISPAVLPVSVPKSELIQENSETVMKPFFH